MTSYISPYTFYLAMNYPIPSKKRIFSYAQKKIIQTQWDIQNSIDNHNISKAQNKEKKRSFSRKKENIYMQEYREHIERFAWIYRNIPGVKSIYLCNSITFNALQRDSDIDICIVSKPWLIRRARFRSWLLFSLSLWRRGVGKSPRKKICLSFYIDSLHQNISNIRISKWDIYLPYRIAHLVPLYSEDNTYSLIQNNKRIQHYLPFHPCQPVIELKTKKYQWRWRRKKIRESKFFSIFTPFFQRIITIAWKWLITVKKHIWKKKNKDVLINKHMLKFYKDKRRQYYLLFKSHARTQRKTRRNQKNKK